MRKILIGGVIVMALLFVWANVFYFFDIYELKIAAFKKSDNMVIVAIPAKFKKGYWPRVSWNELCWIKALDKLNEVRYVKDMEKLRMIQGIRNGVAHAWIEYVDRHGNSIRYDPTLDRKEIREKR